MSNYQGHLLGGVVTYGITLAAIQKLYPLIHLNALEISIWLVMCLLGSLFPDIDIRSKGQRIFYEVLFCATIFAIIFNQWHLIICFCIASVIPLISKHRGSIHSLWFIIFIPMLVPFAITKYHPELTDSAIYCYLFFVMGAFSHLLLDFGPKHLIKRTLFLSKRKRFSKKR